MNDLNVSAPASGLAVRFLDVGGCVRSGEDITREAVDQLLHLIQAAASCPLTCPWTSTARTGAPFSPWILTTAGPPWLSTHGTRRGKRIWISPPPRGAIVRRKPPYISADRRRVRKRNALQDRELAAACVLHFAKTGERYPGLEWEAWEPGV